MSPLAITQAFTLAFRGHSYEVIRRGLTRSAASGTASAIHHKDALAKTGTAPCSHPYRGEGDGYALVMFPSGDPQWTLLVQQHNATGAKAAITAGEMLAIIGNHP